MYKIKICGVRSEETVPVLNQLLPDYVGFILAAGFRRTVSEDTARALRERLDRRICRVGVFVNDSVDRIARLYREGVVNAVQLHGDEDESYIRSLKAVCPAPVIKAVGVAEGRAVRYPENCDVVLLDAYAPTERGGTGRSVLWRRYDEIEKPVLLAGGITPENVAEALAKVQPYGVDSSGGLETDGVKDAAKMEKYVSVIRGINHGK